MRCLLEKAGGDDRVLVWLFFGDLPGHGSHPGNLPAIGAKPWGSPRAVARTGLRGDAGTSRLKGPEEGFIEDLPSERIIRIRRRSRYLGAVSVETRAADVEALASSEGVVRIEPVRTLRRVEARSGSNGPGARKDSKASVLSPAGDPWFTKYGRSLDQLAITGSSDLLERGYDGSGTAGGGEPVMICVLDTGFELEHEAFGGLDVLIQYDFVDDDSVTAQEAGDFPGQSNHGTTVLGTIGGYSSGELIGPAHGARYILAKTEIEGEETIVEEDNWIAALEWADSIGADIVTSSVGYVKWYSEDDLDGATALCTIAADIAASRGIVVVTAMGNLAWNGPTSLIAPADGDSVISVGAVYRYGDIAPFSSLGPTSDGRIKPDVVDMGVSVVSVVPSTISGYGEFNGTSYATPLIAGLCAQLLEIHPEWTPVELIVALKGSADRADSPDNTYGWGVPDGFAAAGLSGGADTDQAYFATGYPNPFSEDIKFHIYLPEWEAVDIDIYDCRGALVVSLADEYPVKWGETFEWDGRNGSGARVAPGVYFLRVGSKSLSRTVKLVRMAP